MTTSLSNAFLVFLYLFIATLTVSHGRADVLHHNVKRFRLTNGLTVLLREDHSSPIVTVNVLYHVGSANEGSGQFGYAHLFEHLMFGGSAHAPQRFISYTDDVGASNVNGFTNEDRTLFTETLPSNALDRVLFLESDRMGYLLLNQASLERERAVVSNEIERNLGQPYRLAEARVAQGSYPRNHPYSHAPSGTKESIDTVGLADVQTWFRTYYRPSNAVVVVVGDFATDAAIGSIRRYFASLPTGPAPLKTRSNVNAIEVKPRDIVEDRVPQPMLIRTWNIPGFGSPDSDFLQLAQMILAHGRNSRIQTSLARSVESAPTVSVEVDSHERGGQLSIQVLANSQETIELADRTVLRECRRLATGHLSAGELAGAKATYERELLEQMENSTFRATAIAEGEMFVHRPEEIELSLRRIQAASATDVATATRRWLLNNAYTLEIVPVTSTGDSANESGKSALPSLGTRSDSTIRFPQVEHLTLTNGLKVVLCERHDLPLVRLDLVVGAGSLREDANVSGMALATATILALNRAPAVADKNVVTAEQLGFAISPNISIDTSELTTVAVTSDLTTVLRLFSEAILHPRFTSEVVAQQSAAQLSQLASEKSNTFVLGKMLLPALLNGANGLPPRSFTGTGTASTIKSFGVEEIEAFYKRWYSPTNATLVIVGDVSARSLLPDLNKLFGGWVAADPPDLLTPKSRVESSTTGGVSEGAIPTYYLIDSPGSPQSVILMGLAAPPISDSSRAPIDLWNDVFAGMISSRLNVALRDEKRWSYGARSTFLSSRTGRLLLAYSSVQQAHTADALSLSMSLIKELSTDKPPTRSEIAAAQKAETMSVQSVNANTQSLMNTLVRMSTNTLSSDYYNRLLQGYLSATPADVAATGKHLLDSSPTVWIVVGDKSHIVAQLDSLHLGKWIELNRDGSPVQ